MYKLSEFKIAFLYIGIFVFLLSSCSTQEESATTTIADVSYLKVSGQTMGTTYNITYADSKKRNFQKQIDDLLLEVNLDVSTYIDTSFISRFNQASKKIVLQSNYASSDSPNRHFLMNYYKAKEVYQKTDGYFDPTIMPLVYYWGFAKKKEKVTEVDKKQVDSLMQFVGFTGVELDQSNHFIYKTKPGVQLDFSAIAKGYGVDAICELFDREDITSYLVEIGGETRAKGVNVNGEVWRLGISTPSSDAAVTDYKTIVRVPNMALASSGNYRNFYEVKGRKYGHTIDTKTGYPKDSDILSASIFAEDCMSADAYATACMSMGLEKSMTLIQSLPDVEAYFIYGDENGKLAVKYTDGVGALLVKE